MTTFKANSLYKPTPEIIEQIKLQRKLYDQEIANFSSSFDKSDEIQYFILSTKFINEWRKFTDQMLSPSLPPEFEVRSPSLMNEQLVKEQLESYNQFVLRKDIHESIDFVFAHQTINQIFQAYQGHRIIRRAYFHGVEKKVQVHPIKFQFVYMSPSWLKIFKENPLSTLPLHRSLAYKNQTVSDLLYRLVEFSKKDPRNRNSKYLNNAAAKIYVGQNFNRVTYASSISKEIGKEKFLPAPGKEIKRDMMIGELEIPPEQPMMVVQLQEQNFIYKQMEIQADENGKVVKDRCQFCRKVRVLPYTCRCKEVSYCTEECKEKDWKYHIRTCENAFEEENKEVLFNFTEKSRRGLVGLQNVGNTCYMNSALQCMQHTRGLSEYFINKFYVNEINEENPIGSKGKLIKAYASFLQSIFTTENDVVTPSRLKYTIGKTKDMFAGYQQHDSQEFLLFMLDTLHEDLNRVLKKPYTDGVENEGRPDPIVAKESWLMYLKRNQSIINDLMGGQYRSEVKCPDCGNISVTFDPYLIFTVPIPSNESKKINLYCFFANYYRQTYKFSIVSKNNVALDIVEDVAKKSKLPTSSIKLWMLGFNGPIRQVGNEESIDKLINEKQFNEGGEERQLFALEFLPEELQNIENKKHLVFKFSKKDVGPSSYKKQVLTFKRPFPFVCDDLKGEKLFDRVCDFLLSLHTHNFARLEGKEYKNKFGVYRQKAKEEKIYKIYMSYGNPKEVKNKLIFEEKIEIQEDTNVTQLLLKNNYEVEFEVQFDKDPFYSFNSYKSYREKDDNDSYSVDFDGYSHSEEEKFTLRQCLDEMKKPEKLLEGNQVFCSFCKDLKLSEKKMQMYKASKYLIIQLRRFKQVGYEKSKNYAEINFPMALDLSKDIIDPSLPETYFQDEIENSQIIKPPYWKGIDKNKKTTFHLYGVINHHGNLGGGHYTAYAKQNEEWFLFDDSRVEKVDTSRLVTKAAYLLFYEREQ